MRSAAAVFRINILFDCVGELSCDVHVLYTISDIIQFLINCSDFLVVTQDIVDVLLRLM